MTDRALLFLVSLVVLIGAVLAAVWLIATGQTGTFDGNFLLLCSLVLAFSFGFFLRNMIKAALPPAKHAPAPPASATKKETVAEPVGKA
jgi:hypothetical protein